MKAAILRELNAPLTIEDVDIDKPGPNEVLTRTAASGICHSDLHIIEGSIPMPMPCILGHEPAGIVEAVGSEVSQFAPGDHVIGCLSAFCGSCEFCIIGKPYLCGGAACNRAADQPPRLSKDGEAIPQFAHLSSFAESMLTHENALVKIRDDMPLDRAALIGCGVTTGLGAVLNTACVRPGNSTAVIGCGGVGLSAIQGCRIAGASRIVAIDNQAWKLELARTMGATDVIDSSEGDPVAQAKELSAGGLDFAFEAIGLKETVSQAVGMIKKGGTAVMVGVVPFGTMIELPGLDITLSEKRVIGSMMGSNRFRIDMPRYVDLYLQGELKLDEMISARLDLEDINGAFDEMRKGTAVRSVVVFD